MRASHVGSGVAFESTGDDDTKRPRWALYGSTDIILVEWLTGGHGNRCLENAHRYKY